MIDSKEKIEEYKARVAARKAASGAKSVVENPEAENSEPKAEAQPETETKKGAQGK